MATSTYNQLNPQLVDPYNIETTLANNVSDPQKIGTALPLLMMYQSDRNLQGQQAARGLEAQHAFNQQKLESEIRDQNVKNIIAARTAGATDLVSASNAGRPAYAGVPSGLLGAKSLLENREAFASILQKAGGGALEAEKSGNPLLPGQLGEVTGLQSGTATPEAIQVAQIKAAADMAGHDSNAVHMSVGGTTNTGQTWGASGKNLDALVRAAKLQEAALNQGGPTPPKAVPPAVVGQIYKHVNDMAAKGDPTAAAIKRNYTGGQPTVRMNGGQVLVKGDGTNWYPIP